MSVEHAHSSASNEHYTPPEIIEAARFTMGGIDLDPASSQLAQTVVKADGWYGLDHPTETWRDGLSWDWWGNVFLNPPGGRLSPKREGTSSQAALFWKRLVEAYEDERVEQAIFIGFNLEILQTSQTVGYPVSDHRLCFPKKRIAYYREENGVLVPGKSPPGASVIVYMGHHVERFREAFGPLGALRL